MMMMPTSTRKTTAAGSSSRSRNAAERLAGSLFTLALLMLMLVAFWRPDMDKIVGGAIAQFAQGRVFADQRYVAQMREVPGPFNMLGLATAVFSTLLLSAAIVCHRRRRLTIHKRSEILALAF